VFRMSRYITFSPLLICTINTFAKTAYLERASVVTLE
jgi:hypothetical protein